MAEPLWDQATVEVFIAKGGDGAVGTIDLLDKHILVGQLVSQFQLRIIDGSFGIFESDKVSNGIRWELSTPKDGLAIAMGGSWEPDSTHASPRSIMGPKGHRVTRNNLSQGSGARSQLMRQCLKVFNLVPHVAGKLFWSFTNMKIYQRSFLWCLWHIDNWPGRHIYS